MGNRCNYILSRCSDCVQCFHFPVCGAQSMRYFEFVNSNRTFRLFSGSSPRRCRFRKDGNFDLIHKGRFQCLFRIYCHQNYFEGCAISILKCSRKCRCSPKSSLRTGRKEAFWQQVEIHCCLTTNVLDSIANLARHKRTQWVPPNAHCCYPL